MGWWPHTCVGCEALGHRVCATCAPDELHDVTTKIDGVAHIWHMSKYLGPLGTVVRQIKYRPDRHLGKRLAARMATACRGHLCPNDIDAVVPVPSTPWTRVRRGFELATLLASDIAHALDRPHIRALSVRGAQHQAGLNRVQRRKNLAGRVTGRRQVPPHVLLVDDVFTTGATAEACALALLQEGASRVWMVTACLADTNSQTVLKIR
ncbi:MAG: putative amidophosphoribosyltransferase [Myxococcota bacterium]|jgi:predicted amidophosphoribosyltransferase